MIPPGMVSGNEVSYSQPYPLEPDDAMSTLTITIVWEQVIPGLQRRLLRTTHVFGAGDHEAKSSIFILPASAQIEDAAESLDAASENAPAPSPAKEDSGLSGGAIAGIIAGGVVVAGGVAYYVMRAQGGAPMRRPESAGYSVVRRSERFSTMNF